MAIASSAISPASTAAAPPAATARARATRPRDLHSLQPVHSIARSTCTGELGVAQPVALVWRVTVQLHSVRWVDRPSDEDAQALFRNCGSAVLRAHVWRSDRVRSVQWGSEQLGRVHRLPRKRRTQPLFPFSLAAASSASRASYRHLVCSQAAGMQHMQARGGVHPALEAV